MSSWISHLPAESALPLGRVEGLGMNAEELAKNPRLAAWRAHDLNDDPRLPYASTSFDFALCAVSFVLALVSMLLAEGWLRYGR